VFVKNDDVADCRLSGDRRKAAPYFFPHLKNTGSDEAGC
jgi:hypothetical protein